MSLNRTLRWAWSVPDDQSKLMTVSQAVRLPNSTSSRKVSLSPAHIYEKCHLYTGHQRHSISKYIEGKIRVIPYTFPHSATRTQGYSPPGTSRILPKIGNGFGPGCNGSEFGLRLILLTGVHNLTHRRRSTIIREHIITSFLSMTVARGWNCWEACESNFVYVPVLHGA